MAATFTMGAVRGSQALMEPNGADLVVPGWVDGISLDSGSDAGALLKVLDATDFPDWYDPLNATYPSYTLRRVEVQGSETKFPRMYVKLYYTNRTGGDPSAHLIRYRGYSSEYETTFLPGTRAAIKVDYIDPDNAANTIKEDLVHMILTRSMLEITVTALVAGHPPESLQAAVDKANDDTWKGYPIGYWRCTGVETTDVVYGGYYSWVSSALTKKNEDWGKFGVLQNRQTGKFVVPPDEAIADLAGRPYEYGIWKPAPPYEHSGLVRVDQYETADFATIFGIS